MLQALSWAGASRYARQEESSDMAEKNQLSQASDVVHMEPNDRELVKRCLEGSERAFETLVDRYQKVVFNVAYRMVNDYDTAEDITQSVFVKGFEKMNTFNPKYRFFSWLYRITVNETLNYIKRMKRLEELSPNIESTAKSPEREYHERELGSKIQSALMELDPKYRIVLVLKHFRECSYKEMSETLEIPEKKVKSRLFTARQLLRPVLVKRGIVEDEG
jgi:RNA polymerase sigma-70 factor (ECF subfamily)